MAAHVAATAAAAPCVAPWHALGTKCYIVPNATGSPAGCSLICQEAANPLGEDAALACVTSSEEQAFIGSITRPPQSGVWIGNYRQRTIADVSVPPPFDKCSNGQRPHFNPSFLDGEPTNRRYEVNM